MSKRGRGRNCSLSSATCGLLLNAGQMPVLGLSLGYHLLLVQQRGSATALWGYLSPLDLDHVAVKETSLGDDHGIGLDVARHPAGRGDFYVSGGNHIPLVSPHDQGVSGVGIGPDNPFFADHQFPLHIDLARYLTLDLNRVRDVELSLQTSGLPHDREQGALPSWTVGVSSAEHSKPPFLMPNH